MNVLVIGGAGYVGSHCVRQLTDAGHRPVVLDNLAYGHRAAVAPDIPFIEGDLGDEELLTKVFAEHGIEAVMHFAAYAYVGESMTDPLKYYDNNIAKSVSLLQAMRKAAVKRFVFSSSCTIFGMPETMPITEDLPRSAISVYGETKLNMEYMLEACAKAYGLSFAALRYFNASGAHADSTIGEDHDPETHLIPLAVAAALGQRDELKIFGDDYPTPDGTCLRDYIHVDDLSRAHIAVLDKLSEPGTALFYNLGTGVPASVKEVLDTVEEVSGLKVPRSIGPRRDGDAPAAYADNSKAVRELNWQLQYPTLKSIVETAWAWHEKHPNGFAG